MNGETHIKIPSLRLPTTLPTLPPFPDLSIAAISNSSSPSTNGKRCRDSIICNDAPDTKRRVSNMFQCCYFSLRCKINRNWTRRHFHCRCIQTFYPFHCPRAQLLPMPRSAVPYRGHLRRRQLPIQHKVRIIRHIQTSQSN